MICITGDTHGDWKNRFSQNVSRQEKRLVGMIMSSSVEILVIGTTLTLKGITLIGLKVSHGLHYL